VRRRGKRGLQDIEVVRVHVLRSPLAQRKWDYPAVNRADKFSPPIPGERARGGVLHGQRDSERINILSEFNDSASHTVHGDIA
jgi:hypothetical protein